VQANEGCQFNGATFGVGEQVFSKDPRLISKLTDVLREKGFDMERAQFVVDQDDWVGYSLRCSRNMRLTEAGELVPDEWVMVLSENYEDYYYAVTGNE